MVGKSFSEELREEATEIWEAILAHPYLTEMGDGTLPLDKFRNYILQDYAYLVEFSRCLGMAVAKAEDMESMSTFASLLNGCLTGEVKNLESLSGRLEIPIDMLREAEPAPANLAYTRHLLHVAFSGTVGEILAALLPCMWTYQIIGEKLAGSPALKDRPFYKEWADVYSSKMYSDLVENYRDLTDRHAESLGPAIKEKMRQHFVLSSRYEYLFWEMAYRGEEGQRQGW